MITPNRNKKATNNLRFKEVPYLNLAIVICVHTYIHKS